jgi:hypothetical protein
MMEIPRMSGLFFWIQLTLFWVDCFRDSLEDLLVDIFGFLFGAFSSEVLVKAFFGGVRTCFFVDLCLNFWSNFRGFKGFMQHNSESF